MAAKLRVLPAILVLLVLVAATGDVGVRMAEGRKCLSRSHRFRGACLSDTNCRHVCHTEGFPEGHCHGFRRRCFCSKPC